MNRYGYDHYVNLLSVRKRVGKRVASQLISELGREPTETEMKNRLNRDYHPRLGQIAFKGWKDWEKRNFMADEELVVSAVITAVMTGQSSLILTRDIDIFDQFMKLFELMISDYMCFRFGEFRFLNPESIEMNSIPIDHKGSKEHGFEGSTMECVLVPNDEADRILPPYDHTPVHCFCVLIGNTCEEPKISIAGYCLEREMGALLFTKAETNGRNSARFPDKNVLIGMKNDAGAVLTMFAICEERIVDYEGVTLSWLDTQHALKGDPALLRKHWLG